MRSARGCWGHGSGERKSRALQQLDCVTRTSLEVAPTTLSDILADRENMALLLVYGFKLVFIVAD